MATTDPRPPSPPSGTTRGPILIVEDDADLREMMAQLLSVEGYTVEAAANGHDALEFLRSGPLPALILLDLMMPVMDGWEFWRRQREDPAISAVPVVVLSAVDYTRAAEFGSAAVLKKPLDFDHLLALVRKYCQ